MMLCSVAGWRRVCRKASAVGQPGEAPAWLHRQINSYKPATQANPILSFFLHEPTDPSQHVLFSTPNATVSFLWQRLQFITRRTSSRPFLQLGQGSCFRSVPSLSFFTCIVVFSAVLLVSVLISRGRWV